MTRGLAIIPARGGSKRLPRKNLLPFQDRPIICHTIEAAVGSGCFARVIVSTEDEEIAAVASAAGADLHHRDSTLASDSARVVDVCASVLNSEEKKGHTYDVFACLYATAPLRQAEDIRAVMALVEPGKASFAIAVTSYSLPPHQALKMSSDGALQPMWPQLIELRASEIGPLVVDNGSTYAARVADFRAQKSFYGTPLRGHHMPRERSIDIDERSDYELVCWYGERLRVTNP